MNISFDCFLQNITDDKKPNPLKEVDWKGRAVKWVQTSLKNPMTAVPILFIVDLLLIEIVIKVCQFIYNRLPKTDELTSGQRGCRDIALISISGYSYITMHRYFLVKSNIAVSPFLASVIASSVFLFNLILQWKRSFNADN